MSSHYTLMPYKAKLPVQDNQVQVRLIEGTEV
jgi:hypothetical protein